MSETTMTRLSSWRCDQCHRLLFHGEIRLNCIVCDDYDLCTECAVSIDPPHPHRLIAELAYGQAKVVDEDEDPNLSIAKAIQRAVSMYDDRYCFGVRDVDKNNPSVYLDIYSWLTFQTVGIRFKNFGSGLRDFIEPRGFLGICSRNRPEWVITDFACILHSIITVPMYCLLNDREITYIVNNTKVSVLVCDKQILDRLVRLHKECPSLRHIVCMDEIPETILSLQHDDLKIHYMMDVENNGSQHMYDPIDTDPDECLTVIHTSGSLGFPKGAMISEKVYRTTFSRVCYASPHDLVQLSYEPLAWSTDRFNTTRTFFLGGRTAFSTGDVSLLIDDLALVRPLVFSGTPAFWNRIYAEYQAALLVSTEENRILEKFSKLIPKRCKVITVGGALISPVVFKFIKKCFSHCFVNESYGTTEAGGVSVNNIVRNSTKVRLASVPEMGYTTDDEPFPRGELLMKTEDMFSGYFNNPEETREAFTEDGFFRTGDIVELRERPNGETYVHLIDRKKNFFKLSQGQYVSPEFLQSIYIESPFVEQIYIHGDLLSDSVSAVVVPNREYVQQYFDINTPNAELHDAILSDLRSIAQRESLRKHEVPSKLIVDFERFTPENGLLTPSSKPCRYKLAAYYGDRLKQFYTVEEKLKNIIETTTNHSLDECFIPTGGDSLTALHLFRKIENDLGVSVPISLLLRPDLTIQELTTIIKDPSKISSMSHSITQQLLNDSELVLDTTINQCKNTDTSPSIVFVTGVTGFVGAFLLAELLSTYPKECKFMCLVRCKCPTDALNRIKDTMLFYKIWKDEFPERIISVVGDLERPNLGLDPTRYELLANKIDVIFHCGAAVNFVLPYSQLYSTNVGGTREIIRLATHSTACISVHYISTLSVLSRYVSKEVSIDETSPDGLNNGYAQSKWVAEKLMTKASNLGLPVSIYRLGSICASTETGACNPNDIYTYLLAAILNLRCYPNSIVDGRFRGLPVNFTAKTITYLSNSKNNAFGKVYHILNPNSESLFKDIIDSMNKSGIQLESLSFEEWRAKLKTIHDERNPLGAVTELINENFFQNCNNICAEEFCNAMSSLDFPPFDNPYLTKWCHFILNNIAKR